MGLLGEILIRFYVNGPLRHRLLNGDPHPGNALFGADGRVAFVDFGFFKRLSDADVHQLIATTRATYEGDAQKLLDVVVDLGALPPDASLAEPFLESYRAIFGWLPSSFSIARKNASIPAGSTPAAFSMASPSRSAARSASRL